jgi:hypothetical protein
MAFALLPPNRFINTGTSGKREMLMARAARLASASAGGRASHLPPESRPSHSTASDSRVVRAHAVLCAAGFNIRWLLRVAMRRGPTDFFLVLAAQSLLADCAVIDLCMFSPRPGPRQASTQFT